MREKRKCPAAIAEIITAGVRLPKLAGQMKRWRILAKWEAIVGEAVAGHARPARWAGGTLVVRVDGHAWLQELSFVRPQMLARIQQEFPDLKISAIRLEAGELPPLPAGGSVPAARRNDVPLGEDEREFIDRAVERIADDALRDAARRAMTKGFQRRDKR